MSTNGLSLDLNPRPVRRKITKSNRKASYFRKVICAGRHRLLELITIPPGQEIADEARDAADRVFFVVAGKGKALLDGDAGTVLQQDVIFVPAGTRHQIRNTGSSRMRVFSVSSPSATSFIY